MCTNDSNSGRGSKTSSPLCLPSNNRLRRDECALGIHQNTTGEIQTQYPHFQRLMMSRKDGVGQVIKAFVTVVTLIALTGRFRVIKAALDHMLRLTRGTLDAIRPAQRTNCLITLPIIDEIRDVNLHGWTPVEGSWNGMASVYTILQCHDPGIQY